MRFVEPIKKKGDITLMKRYLKNDDLRNYTLFMLGINSALRVSDLLAFKVSDVQNPDGTIKERITIKEQKTGKTRIFPFSEKLQKALVDYLKQANLDIESVLFPSREGVNKPITRQTVHVFIKEAGEACGIKENLSTHTLRKTWSYQYYTNNIKENPGIINTLQKILNHKDSSTTLRYIGITQEEIDDAFMNNAL